MYRRKAQLARPQTSADFTDAQTLALGLFVATFEVFLGMRALLREGLAEEARMLSRTLLDDTARLIWFANARDDPNELEARALRFVFDSLEFEGPLMRAARDNGYGWAGEELEGIAEELEAIKGEAESKGIALKRMRRRRGREGRRRPGRCRPGTGRLPRRSSGSGRHPRRERYGGGGRRRLGREAG